ncbi:hypothetical protein WDU94_013052 [Cyamophila willieti]
MKRVLLLLSLLICCIVSINTDDTLDTTVKKRRGRPKKVNTENDVAVKVTTRPIVTSSGEKVTSRQEVTTIPPGPTKTTFDEYETWFDSSGYWNGPKKVRPNATTKKTRKLKSTRKPKTTTKRDSLDDDDDGVTGALEAMYYKMKRHYVQPENRREAAQKVKKMIQKHDVDHNITHYTWVSIEDKELGKMNHENLKNYPELQAQLSGMQE